MWRVPVTSISLESISKSTFQIPLSTFRSPFFTLINLDLYPGVETQLHPSELTYCMFLFSAVVFFPFPVHSCWWFLDHKLYQSLPQYWHILLLSFPSLTLPVLFFLHPFLFIASLSSLCLSFLHLCLLFLSSLSLHLSSGHLGNTCSRD